jgi:NADPH:quinone reductase-like Zn-dependent oxidoreductase
MPPKFWPRIFTRSYGLTPSAITPIGVDPSTLTAKLTPFQTIPGPSHSIKNRLFAITGAASGIGRATATLLVESGAKVSLADKDEDAVTALAKSLGPNAWGYSVDVTNREQVEHWLKHASSRWSMQELDGECMAFFQGIGKDILSMGIWEMGVSD